MLARPLSYLSGPSHYISYQMVPCLRAVSVTSGGAGGGASAEGIELGASHAPNVLYHCYVPIPACRAVQSLARQLTVQADATGKGTATKTERCFVLSSYLVILLVLCSGVGSEAICDARDLI